MRDCGDDLVDEIGMMCERLIGRMCVRDRETEKIPVRTSRAQRQFS